MKQAMSGMNRTQPPNGGRLEALGALLGAILVHPIIFALVWFRGIESGMDGVGELLVLYFNTPSVPLLLFSAIGGAIGFAVVRHIHKLRGQRIELTTVIVMDRAASIRITAAWASAIYLADLLISQLSRLLSGTAGWTLLIVYLTVWMIGALAAYIHYRSWRIAVWLVGIGVGHFLLCVFWPLPVEAGLLIAILVLIYVISTHWRAIIPRDAHVATEEYPPQLPAVSGWAVFCFGAMTFYVLVCLYAFFWALSLSRGSENWGPGVIIILGPWGMPIFGTVAAIVRVWTDAWSWLTTRTAWVVVACEVLVCAAIWLAMLGHG